MMTKIPFSDSKNEDKRIKYFSLTENPKNEFFKAKHMAKIPFLTKDTFFQKKKHKPI